MSKEDDLTLQIGFAPDLASLKKAAEEGAKAYSDKFSQQLAARLKLPKGYTSSFEPGHHLHNAQKLAEDDFIRDSDISRVTREFKEAALSMIKGLTKGLTRFSGQLIGEAYNGVKGEVNWVRGHYPDSPMWHRPQALPAPDTPGTLYLEHPAVSSARRGLEDFNESIRNERSSTKQVDRMRMQDLANAARIYKHFDMPDSAYYDSQLNSAANFGRANPAYKLRATQFIKDPEYRKKFTDLLNAYGKPEGFFEMPAASTWKYHPLFAHGYGGLARHTEAVMQGVFQDAVKAGFSPADTDKLLFASGLHDALKYQGGRPNASHAHDMAFVLDQLGYKDEASWVKTHMGEVKSGYGKGKGPEKGNLYQKIIADTDFLVSRQYAQNFVSARNGSMSPDMDKLREEAVRRGEGRWIDPNKPHTFDNWERVVKSSGKVKDSTKSTLEYLRNIAGVLAVIHAVNKAIKAVRAFDRSAEKGIQDTATGLPNRRYYGGFDEYTALRNQSAAAAAGISRDAVNSDVVNFSAKRGEMTLMGKGFNLLPVSVLGQWQNMMKEGDANTAWWNTLGAISSRYAGASQKEREQLQKLVDDTLGKSATELLAFSRNTGIPISQLTAMRENPNYSAYGSTEGMNYDVSKLNDSINASYLKMYEDWMRSFGIPFRDFWDRLLIDFTNNPLYKYIVGNGGNSVEADVASLVYNPLSPAALLDFTVGKKARARDAVTGAINPHTVAYEAKGRKQAVEEMGLLMKNRPESVSISRSQDELAEAYTYRQALVKLQELGLDIPLYKEAIEPLNDWVSDKKDYTARNFSLTLFKTLNKNKGKSAPEQIAAVNSALTDFLGNVKYWDIAQNPNLSKRDKMEFTTGTLKIDLTHDYAQDTSETIRVNGKIVGPGWNNSVELPMKLQALPTGK